MVSILLVRFNTLLTSLVIVFDFIFFLLTGAIIVEFGLFMCESLIAVTILISGVVPELVVLLRQLITKRNGPALILAYWLQQFRKHHHCLIKLVLIIDSVFSAFLFPYVFANLFFNAFCVSFIFFNSIPPMEQFIFSLVCLVQVMGFIFGEYPTIASNRLLANSTKPLHQLMPLIHCKKTLPLGMKVRFMTCYENSHHSQPLGHNFGPFGANSLKCILEVCLLDQP